MNPNWKPVFPLGMPHAEPEFDLTHLRVLRLWHWREVLRCSANIRYHENNRSPAWVLNAQKKRHALHMGAVQALNDLFPIGDTAEKDNDGL